MNDTSASFSIITAGFSRFLQRAKDAPAAVKWTFMAIVFIQIELYLRIQFADGLKASWVLATADSLFGWVRVCATCATHILLSGIKASLVSLLDESLGPSIANAFPDYNFLASDDHFVWTASILLSASIYSSNIQNILLNILPFELFDFSVLNTSTASLVDAEDGPTATRIQGNITPSTNPSYPLSSTGSSSTTAFSPALSALPIKWDNAVDNKKSNKGRRGTKRTALMEIKDDKAKAGPHIVVKARQALTSSKQPTASSAQALSKFERAVQQELQKLSPVSGEHLAPTFNSKQSTAPPPKLKPAPLVVKKAPSLFIPRKPVNSKPIQGTTRGNHSPGNGTVWTTDSALKEFISEKPKIKSMEEFCQEIIRNTNRRMDEIKPNLDDLKKRLGSTNSAPTSRYTPFNTVQSAKHRGGPPNKPLSVSSSNNSANLSAPTVQGPPSTAIGQGKICIKESQASRLNTPSTGLVPQPAYRQPSLESAPRTYASNPMVQSTRSFLQAASPTVAPISFSSTSMILDQGSFTQVPLSILSTSWPISPSVAQSNPLVPEIMDVPMMSAEEFDFIHSQQSFASQPQVAEQRIWYEIPMEMAEPTASEEMMITDAEISGAAILIDVKGKGRATVDVEMTADSEVSGWNTNIGFYDFDQQQSHSVPVNEIHEAEVDMDSNWVLSNSPMVEDLKTDEGSHSDVEQQSTGLSTVPAVLYDPVLLEMHDRKPESYSQQIAMAPTQRLGTAIPLASQAAVSTAQATQITEYLSVTTSSWESITGQAQRTLPPAIRHTPQRPSRLREIVTAEPVVLRPAFTDAPIPEPASPVVDTEQTARDPLILPSTSVRQGRSRSNAISASPTAVSTSSDALTPAQDHPPPSSASTSKAAVSSTTSQDPNISRRNAWLDELEAEDMDFLKKENATKPSLSNGWHDSTSKNAKGAKNAYRG